MQVELARVRMKADILELERLERGEHVREGAVRVVEGILAEGFPEERRVRSSADLRNDVLRAPVRHLELREQRCLRLFGERVRAAVPGEPPARSRGADAVWVVEQIGVGRRVLFVSQRGHRAEAGVVPFGAAELHGQIVRRTVGMVRVVAHVAHDMCPDAGKALVEEELLATTNAASRSAAARSPWARSSSGERRRARDLRFSLRTRGRFDLVAAEGTQSGNGRGALRRGRKSLYRRSLHLIAQTFVWVASGPTWGVRESSFVVLWV